MKFQAIFKLLQIREIHEIPFKSVIHYIKIRVIREIPFKSAILAPSVIKK